MVDTRTIINVTYWVMCLWHGQKPQLCTLMQNRGSNKQQYVRIRNRFIERVKPTQNAKMLWMWIMSGLEGVHDIESVRKSEILLYILTISLVDCVGMTNINIWLSPRARVRTHQQIGGFSIAKTITSDDMCHISCESFLQTFVQTLCIHSFFYKNMIFILIRDFTFAILGNILNF